MNIFRMVGKKLEGDKLLITFFFLIFLSYYNMD